MVSSQNGDHHRNGHVLVANHQTRLDADNENHEPRKSKVYRSILINLHSSQNEKHHPVFIALDRDPSIY